MRGLVGLGTKRLTFFVRVSTPIDRVRRCGVGILSAEDVGGYRHGETFWSIPSRLSAERMKAGPHVREERVPPRAADRRLLSFRMVN